MPVIDKSARRDGTFERDHFIYDRDVDDYVCPNAAPGFGISLLNQAGAEAWPITGATFILVYKAPGTGPAVAGTLTSSRRSRRRQEHSRSDELLAQLVQQTRIWLP